VQGVVDIDANIAFTLHDYAVYGSLSFVPGFGNKKPFLFLPTLIVTTPPIVENISMKGGLKSGYNLPTLQSLVKENPYIAPNVHTDLESYTKIFALASYAGADNLHLGLEAGYDIIKNKYFYTLDKDAVLNNMFSLSYDNANRF
jgi:hypothetical protein